MEGFRLSGCFFNGCVAIGRGDQAPLRRSRNITGGVSCGEQNRGAVGRAELVLAHVACLQGKKKGGAFSARHRVFVALRGRPGRTRRCRRPGAWRNEKVRSLRFPGQSLVRVVSGGPAKHRKRLGRKCFDFFCGGLGNFYFDYYRGSW